VGMIVRFNVISYLIKEGFSNVFKNKKSTISSFLLTTFIFVLLISKFDFIIAYIFF